MDNKEKLHRSCKWCAKLIRDLAEDSELYKNCLCSEKCKQELIKAGEDWKNLSYE